MYSTRALNWSTAMRVSHSARNGLYPEATQDSRMYYSYNLQALRRNREWCQNAMGWFQRAVLARRTTRLHRNKRHEHS